MTKHERDMKRAGLMVRYSLYESEFRKRFEFLKNTLRCDPLSSGRNYTREQITQWTAEAEAFSVAMDQAQNALFSDTVAFLQEAAAALPTE